MNNSQPTIILVGTQLSRNIGSTCRVMLNYGLTQLSLVMPQCDPFDDDCRALATSAHSLVHQAQQYDTLKAACAPHAIRIGLTRKCGKTRKLDGTLHSFLPKLLEEHPNSFSSLAYVFGPEESGLSNQSTECCDFLVKLPTSETFGSMNLSHAVACVCYETACIRASLAEKRAEQSDIDGETLNNTHKQVFESITRYLDQVDIYTAAPRSILLQRLEGILHRSMLSQHDLHFFHKIIEQTRRKLNKQDH